MTAQTHSPVMIAAGGTGGHVYPALAVARVLQESDVPVVWMGTRQGLEGRVVPAAGIPMEWISVAGLRGKSFRDTLLGPLKLVRSLYQAFRAFRRHRPRAVLGMGGFVAGPGGLMALLTRKPLVIHEQNSVAGLTNRLLSRFASRVLTAFPDVLGACQSVEQIGNPVRRDIEQLGATRSAERNSSACHVLVVGGSLGARTLNRNVPPALAQWLSTSDTNTALSVWHQTGSAELDATRAAYAAHDMIDTAENATGGTSSVRVDAFIDDMVAAYDWADLVICRAGAMTISELSAAGLPGILVPYPYAVDDHQTTNALWLVNADAAISIADEALSAERLATELSALLSDGERLAQMSVNARRVFKPNAARRVADALLEVSA